MIGVKDGIIIIISVSLCTYGIRLIPFLLFGGKKEMPAKIENLVNLFPPAIIAALIVYCLKNTSLKNFNDSLPALIAITVTAIIHIYKKNTMLSIIVGTLIYMLLIHYH